MAPSGMSGSPIIDVDNEIIVNWHNNRSNQNSIGFSMIPAHDTDFPLAKTSDYCP